jgi:hypothetical protein
MSGTGGAVHTFAICERISFEKSSPVRRSTPVSAPQCHAIRHAIRRK